MSQEVRKILASNIKILREKSGLKREKLSLLLDFDNSYISKLEKGHVNITLDKLEKIAGFFNVAVIDLFRV
jgi:transcriptional regulator with XRE-family HTH domain